MPNFDDLFTDQPAQQGEKPFDKAAWAARKQAEREGVYAMIDNYVQNMSKEGGLFQARPNAQRPLNWLTSTVGRPAVCMSGGGRMPSPLWNRARSTNGTMVAWAYPTM